MYRELGAHPVRTDVQVLVSEHKVLGLSVITSKSVRARTRFAKT